MQQSLVQRIRMAVKAWAQETYQTDAVVVSQAVLDDEIDEEADRYLVDHAVRRVGHWLVAEVWIGETGQVLSIHDLGEGLPIDDAPWPWSVSGEPT